MTRAEVVAFVKFSIAPFTAASMQSVEIPLPDSRSSCFPYRSTSFDSFLNFAKSIGFNMSALDRQELVFKSSRSSLDILRLDSPERKYCFGAHALPQRPIS